MDPITGGGLLAPLFIAMAGLAFGNHYHGGALGRAAACDESAAPRAQPTAKCHAVFEPMVLPCAGEAAGSVIVKLCAQESMLTGTDDAQMSSR